MVTYYDESREYHEPRAFPYTGAASEPAQSGYVDFKQNPEMIEQSLEDFRSSAGEPATRCYVDFLRWLNGPDSQLESCDSAFRAPQPHADLNSPLKLCATGRVVLMYRHLE